MDAGHLSKGPYLEGTQVFKRGDTPRALLRSLGLQPDEGFLKALEGDRPLYQHQEQAIRQVHEGSNVIVATGTGSGKTEAFLYPILVHLYQEFITGKLCPGVRALVLYPMNALANDQRERLGEISKWLEQQKSPFRFTFGQYIGETPEDENDSRRHARDHIANRLPGESVLRSEMRSAPPHILLTNYSMLEYLLLRPTDSPLFDPATWWKFLVLDEAHQYRGSRGIEMAMLLRRLKRRLREGSRTGPFRCLATSATLAGGKGDTAAVAKFASDLFGEEFRDEDVILGEHESIPEPGPAILSPDAYGVIANALSGESEKARRTVAGLTAKLGVVAVSGESLGQALGRLLLNDRRAGNLRNYVSGKPRHVDEAAAQVFDDLPAEEQVPALSELVKVLLQAEDPGSGAPLLSARYHFLLRSLEGAFVSYWPSKKVFLDRMAVGGGRPAFEVALCRECGQHYLLGPKNLKAGKLAEAIRDPSHADFGAAFFRPVDDGLNQDEEDTGDEATSRQVLQLCTRCGEMGKDRLKCGHEDVIRVVREESPADKDRADQVAKCGACGYNAAGRDPVREVVHGTDGPHAVIATTLYQNLVRKKVLAFADGRQEAAFFAWYLQNSYERILSRNLLLQATKRLAPDTVEGLSLQELAGALRVLFRERKVFPPAMGDVELRSKAWLGVYQELLTDEPRISLEGVGLVRWSIQWPEWIGVPSAFTGHPWSLTEEEAQDLVFILLDSMRTDRAVELRPEKNVPVTWSDLGLQPQMRFRIGGGKGFRAWDGRMGKRARFLAKLLMRVRNGIPEQEAIEAAVYALRAVWDAVRNGDEDAPSSNDRLLLSVDDAERLNPDWWRVRLVTDDDSLYQCNTCGRIQGVSVQAVCPRHGCPGTLKQIRLKELAPNHYRLLYEADLPGILRVEEHTAQLDHEKAREFQREFKKGSIHVLSCSTTFELGVDLGDLDTIFLRNVPPEAFNYAQRVGRAGRRRGYPGFAITYCRRGPHDLYHFSEPQRMLSGMVRPPTLSLRNERIIVRHMAATALSHFFRRYPDRFKTVETLFRDFEHPSGVTDFNAFLLANRTSLEETLRAIIPSDLAQIGLADGNWIEQIAGDKSRFSQAEAEVSSDYRNVSKLEETAGSKRDYRTADWAKARARTIADEDVLSFLSRKPVIPKYGFPVDVVELDTQRTSHSQASEVLLQRDLSIAISEFAPTSQLVANKKVWTSCGLKKVAGKEWDRWFYKRCPQHNVFLRWQGDAEPAAACGDALRVCEYVIPSFGFITDRDRPKDPTSRPQRVFTTRPYFAGALGPNPDTVTMPLNPPLITMKKASPGLMVVLCEGHRGNGFFVCQECGAGLRKIEKSHKTPYGQDCRGTLKRVSLGHQFTTDVLQVQFHPEPEEAVEPVWFALSVAYALVEGAAEILDIPTTDLSAVVGSQQHPMPPIILYDNVPGGAGLVARLEDEEMLKRCLEAARQRVIGNCGCDGNTSCYGCLRSYRNQFAHQYLRREPVLRYLETLLSKWG
ncbi:MAG: DEAD/DEAH box helicase [Chloroflexi bacterium]|nr:DEAD/DEAH box helicase [Chloroflexota bacterium]